MRDFRSAFETFLGAFRKRGGEHLGLTAGEAFLAYLGVFGYDEAVRALPANGDVLPYHNFVNPVELGQVYRVVYTMADGGTAEYCYRADGATFQGEAAVTGFAAKAA